MMSNLLKRLEMVEELMNPPRQRSDDPVFVRPDRTIAGRLIIGPGVNEVLEEDDEDKPAQTGSRSGPLKSKTADILKDRRRLPKDKPTKRKRTIKQ
jgi:hypothetical protein